MLIMFKNIFLHEQLITLSLNFICMDQSFVRSYEIMVNMEED